MGYKAIDRATNEYKIAHRNIDEMFNIFALDTNERTRTAFIQKVTSYFTDTTQISDFIAEEISKKIKSL